MKTNNVTTAMSVAKRQVEPRDRALIRSTKACKIKQPEIETRLHVFTISHINIPMKKQGKFEQNGCRKGSRAAKTGRAAIWIVMNFPAVFARSTLTKWCPPLRWSTLVPSALNTEGAEDFALTVDRWPQRVL